ncbi:MAG: hypothetical protein AAF623_17425 [Planctomycetota bacterium]
MIKDPNPYQSPQPQSAEFEKEDRKSLVEPNDRRSATKSVQITSILLGSAAMMNAQCLAKEFADISVLGNQSLSNFSYYVNWIFAIGVNGLLVVVLTAASFVFGLRVLERITYWIHQLTFAKAPLSQWNQSVYRTLRSLPWLALVGSIGWCFWCYQFFLLERRSFLSTLPFILFGHLVAAAAYIPLLIRWFWIEFRARSSPS